MAHFGIERIGDVIDIGGGQSGMLQAETDRTFGQLMRVVEFRRLAMLDAVEPSSSTAATSLPSTSSGGRLVIDRINSKIFKGRHLYVRWRIGEY